MEQAGEARPNASAIVTIVAVDEALLRAARSRELAQAERDLELFLLSSRTRFQFPIQSSFQRLLSHRLARHFGLGHSVMSVQGHGAAVVAYKTPETCFPPVRLCDLFLPGEYGAAPEEQASVAAAAPVLLLRRPAAASAADSEALAASAATTAAAAATASANDEAAALQEREAKYLQAKMRIFGREAVEEHAKEDQLEELRVVTADPPPSSLTAAAASPAAAAPTPDAAKAKRLFNPNAPSFALQQQSLPPPASPLQQPLRAKSAPQQTPPPAAVAGAAALFRSAPTVPRAATGEAHFAMGQQLPVAHVRVAPSSMTLERVLRECGPLGCRYARVIVPSGAVAVVFGSVAEADAAAVKLGLGPLAVLVADPNES